MKTTVFLILSCLIFFTVSAQENDFENNYDAHIAFADSIYQAGNDLIQDDQLEKGLMKVKNALEIYNHYTYVDHKVDKAVCYVSIAFCYLRLGEEEQTKLWLEKVGNRLGKERIWLDTVAGLYGEMGEEQLHKKYSRKSEKCD